MDLSLMIYIGGAAAFAGVVAYLLLRREQGTPRAALAAAGTTAAVAASFLLMLLLARSVSALAAMGLLAVLSGAITYLVFRRDLGPRQAALIAVGATIVIGAFSLFVIYLAIISLILAAGVYLLLRTRLEVAPALVLMGGALTGLLALSGAAFWIALSTM
jgi:hypothetical protein